MTLRPEPYEHLVSDRIFGAIAAFEKEARARGVDPSALAIAWVLHHPQMTAAIVGPRKPSHLDGPLAALDVRLSAADWNRLAALF
jgi:aryl-alcohol dehydrogenase-like predicted oxidoreductase